MILFGCYSRRYWAWPKFPVSRRVIINAPFPELLIPRLDQAEHAYRIPPPQEKPRP